MYLGIVKLFKNTFQQSYFKKTRYIIKFLLVVKYVRI